MDTPFITILAAGSQLLAPDPKGNLIADLSSGGIDRCGDFTVLYLNMNLVFIDSSHFPPP